VNSIDDFRSGNICVWMHILAAAEFYPPNLPNFAHISTTYPGRTWVRGVK